MVLCEAEVFPAVSQVMVRLGRDSTSLSQPGCSRKSLSGISSQKINTGLDGLRESEDPCGSRVVAGNFPTKAPLVVVVWCFSLSVQCDR